MGTSYLPYTFWFPLWTGNIPKNRNEKEIQTMVRLNIAKGYGIGLEITVDITVNGHQIYGRNRYGSLQTELANEYNIKL